MTPRLLLRLAATAALLLAIGHTLGAPWTPATGAAGAAVVESMRSFRFDAMGNARTYWDFYQGFGVSISIYLFAQAIVLWQLAGAMRQDVCGMRPILLVMATSYLAIGLVSFGYFFAVPLVLAVLVAGLTGAAWLLSRPGDAASSQADDFER